MFPSETEILMAIALKKSGKKLVNRPVDVTSEYIVYLRDSLVKRGYLKKNRIKGYQLTSVGWRTLLEFLRDHEARTKNAIAKLKQLGIEYSQDMDKLRTRA